MQRTYEAKEGRKAVQKQLYTLEQVLRDDFVARPDDKKQAMRGLMDANLGPPVSESSLDVEDLIG